MAHLILMAEGFHDGIENMLHDLREGCVYELEKGAKGEVGNKAQPTIREIRFFDVVVKESYKDKFLADAKAAFGYSFFDGKVGNHRVEGASYDKTKERVGHGVDGKGFPIGIFRKLMQFGLKLINCRMINWGSIKATPTGDNRLLQYKKKREEEAKREGKPVPVWHGHYMFLGELPDGFVKTGPLKGRENT